jgi:hypothetical protein
MAVSVAEAEALRPEGLLLGVRRHLARHAAWDALLFSLPTLLAFCYIAFFSYRFGRLAPSILLAAGALFFLGFGALGLWRYYSLVPSLGAVARLIDERTRGENRFVTLATVDPRSSSPALWSRLRQEAVSFLRRLDVDRDFPFRLRRSFFDSLIASLALILLFHLFIELEPRLAGRQESVQELASLAERLGQVPRFAELADRLKALAAKLPDPTVTVEEKRLAIERALQEVKKQLSAQPTQAGNNQELLQQTKDTLSALQDNLEKGEEKGAGGGAERSPEGRGGRGEQSEGEGTKDAQQRDGQSPSKDLAESSPAQSPTAGARDSKGNGEGGRSGAGAEPRGKDQGGASKADQTAGAETKLTKGKSEQNPTGGVSERFLRPGEHAGPGAKDARFVIVQLPEDEIEGGSTGARKKKNALARPPVGNLPLRRPDSPEASPEQQRMPLEYRGLIK